MKRAFSILILATFLFNLGGYYFFFWVMKVQATKELSSKIDAGNYSENETFEIKIPITLPYPVQTTDYERQAGQFVYKGEHFQLVKQKYENDTLTVVCVKDLESKQITNVMDSFSEGSGDQSTQSGALNISIKVVQEYVNSFATTVNFVDGWSQPIQHTPYINNFNQVSLTSLSPPPWA